MRGASRRSFLAITTGALVAPITAFAEQKEGVPSLLDHILLGCNDLDRGVSFVEEHTGVRAAFGGAHPGRGTHNALLSLGERRYLEIIAPDPAQSEIEKFALTQVAHLKELSSPRLVGWAAHPGDLEKFSARLRETGVAFQGPWPGSRKRSDGRVLEWKTLNLKDDDSGLLPFFIEWSADSVHPSADSPKGCLLLHFEACTPEPNTLANTAKQLSLDLSVVKDAKPQLRARIAGPNGKVMDIAS